MKKSNKAKRKVVIPKKPSGRPPKPSGRPPGKSGEKVITSRDRLLIAAIRLFADRGYEGVSTGQVAIAASLTQSMVHYHFRSKSKLWKAAVEKVIRDRGDLVPNSAQDLRDLDALSRLKVLIRRFIMINSSHPDLARIAVQEGMVRSPRLRWLVSKYVGTTYRRMDEVIQEAIDKGLMRNLPVYEITNTILISGSIPFTLGAWTEEIYKVRIGDARAVEAYSDVLMSILFEGLQPRGA